MKKPLPFGKYYLLERINVGGMAEVFRAKAYGVEGFERLVAVKRILPNIAEDKDFIRMFVDEAKISVQLNHANIAQVFDLGVVDGAYYIALEHIHGRDLRLIYERCRVHGEPMPVAQACFVVMKVCEGLDYAHNKRDATGGDLHLVHRDVSPQNILVSFEGEVKLIDFGIAKAAGKGSKTQAGILKGKFGYMSPEQVRGLPIDRRSDVFSCGIVLYELLTGERLFVGESDFSTLEKVRNVEILPPSTYNRKIPDELERICLKALAKDVEERYQNAIDLHDELQAFVYTAGEFYSRKDLAGWMKRVYAKEIEEETGKLEVYRQLKPPPELLQPGRAPVGTKPPPIPGRRTAPSAPPPGREGRSSAPPPAPVGVATEVRADGLAWDEDELETQIYDNPDDKREEAGKPEPDSTAKLGKLRMGPGRDVDATQRDTPAVAAADASSTDTGDVTTERMPAVSQGGPGLAVAPSTTKDGWEVPSWVEGADDGKAPRPPASIAVGSAQSPSPFGMEGALEARGQAVSSAAEELIAHARTPRLTAPPPRRGPSRTTIAAAGAVGAVVLIGAVLVATLGGSPAKPTFDPNLTGMDLHVSPGQVPSWSLDGQAQSGRLPAQIRALAPGRHTIAVEAPAGFLARTETVEVVANQARKVEIALEPVPVAAMFNSTPSGAEVSLIVDGARTKIGKTPVTYKLDPRRSYQLVVELEGYVAKTQPIVLSGAAEELVTIALDQATVVVDPSSDGGTPRDDAKPAIAEAHLDRTVERPRRPSVTPPVIADPKPAQAKPETSTAADPKPVEVTPPVAVDPKPPVATTREGTLSLGSKPPCDIFIDGRNTGLKTPQRDLKLPAGSHRITLINNEFGIRDSFTVDIKAGDTTKSVRDLSAKLPTQN